MNWGRPRVAVGAAAAATAFLLAHPSGAFAGTVSLSGSTISYLASAGETNDVVVSLASGTYTISDTSAVTAGAGCAPVDSHHATCPAAGITSLSVSLGDGDDRLVTEASTPATIDGGTGDDWLNGGTGNDTINGGDGADHLSTDSTTPAQDVGPNVLNGDAGNDTLYGGNQPTTEDGGPGADVLYGGGADDLLHGGDGADTLYGQGGNDVLDGDAGDDTLEHDMGADDLNGGDGVDTAVFDGGQGPTATGGTGETITLDGVANDGDPTDDSGGRRDNLATDVENVIGSPGDDTITGSADANSLHGYGGNDHLIGGGGNDELYGDNGSDTLDGGIGNDTLIGDFFFGDSGSDTLNGESGDDLLDGGPGADLLNGGVGVDAADYSLRSDPVDVTLDGQANDGGVGEADNVGTDAEDVYGGAGDDRLVGNAQPNLLDGGDGDDSLDGGLGSDMLIGGDGLGDSVDYSSRLSPVTIRLDGTATSGQTGENDTIAADVESAVGGAGADTFVGNESDNVFDGGPGADSFSGGDGFDAVDYSSRSGAVSVSLDGLANDGASGESDNVGTGMEDAFGGSGDDHFSGNDASNFFAGGAGADLLEGAGGDDFLLGESGADSLIGGPGFDTLDGGDDNDSIQSRDGVEDDVFCGAGTDGVVADLSDSTFDCETVHRGPPVVTTGAATELTQTTVKLSGTVNPAGQVTTAYVEIGTTAGYGTRSPGASLPAEVASYGLTSTWSSLLPGTTYHYRFLATNADGTTYGADQVFTTAGTSPGADLALTAFEAPDPVTVAKQLTYTLIVANRGPLTAAAVTLSDPLPPGLALVSASASQGGCTSTAPVRCDLGSLASGANATVTIVARAKAIGTISNTATVSSSTADPLTTNNSATSTTRVKAPLAPCLVPNVKRKTLAAAKKAITRAHCKLGRVRLVSSSTVRRGRVIAQRPAPHRHLRNGSKVNLVVSRGRGHR
jgi:uncharacterized repeat protein (TIGR01451 family)